MRPKVVKSKQKASRLHGSSAHFVSLVDRGANETPFTLIKSQQHGATAMTIKKRNKSRKSHKSVAEPTKQAASTEAERTETVVAKMVFDSGEFETEQNVRDYLEKAEWDVENDISIEETDDGWIARPEGTSDDDYKRVSKVDLEEEGVEAFVGELVVKEDEEEDDEDEEEEDEEDEEDDEQEVEAKKGGKKKPYKKAKPQPAAKSEDGDKKKSGDEGGKPKNVSKRAEFLSKRAEERTNEKKFDNWDARMSSGNTLAETIKAGMSWDGVPPGYYDVASAFNSAVANIVKGDDDDKQEMLNKAASDYAEIIGALDSYFDAYIEGGETMMAKAVGSDNEEAAEALEAWAKGYADFANGETTPVEQQQTVAKSADTAPAATIDYKKMDDAISSVVTKALKPVHDTLEELSGTVEAVASRRPSKKAADATDGSAAKPRKIGKKDTDEDDRGYETFSKSLFG